MMPKGINAMGNKSKLQSVTVALAMAFAPSLASTARADTVYGPAIASDNASDAGSALSDGGSGSPASPPSSSDSGGYFAHWFDRVKAAQASQPHWITPVATVTPRLEEEFRFDTAFAQTSTGAHIAHYGLGKGLELIPTTTNEILLNIPDYTARSVKSPAEGFVDDTFLMVKQRFLSANEENGNYIVTGFLSVAAPTGVAAFSNHAWIVTPTLAGGKGWGRFDIQATLGASFPLRRDSVIGTSILGNATFQYHLGKVFWPEFEVNTTHWTSGPREGLTQVFLTPGAVLGRFHIAGRLKAIVGAGYQIAVAPALVKTPALTPLYKHQLIITTRLAF